MPSTADGDDSVWRDVLRQTQIDQVTDKVLEQGSIVREGNIWPASFLDIYSSRIFLLDKQIYHESHTFFEPCLDFQILIQVQCRRVFHRDRPWSHRQRHPGYPCWTSSPTPAMKTCRSRTKAWVRHLVSDNIRLRWMWLCLHMQRLLFQTVPKK